MIEKIFDLEGARVNYSSQGTAYIAYPELTENKQLQLVFAIHGSGRSALDYRDTPFYARQRDIAIENGCIFASVSNVRDTWGRDDGLYNVSLLIDYMKKHFNIKEKVVLWSTSAGGTLACRMVEKYPEKILLVIGTFPVYDLEAAFELSSCKTAWKTDDFEVFSKAIVGRNPREFSRALKYHKFFIAHGDKDDVVPLKLHSEKLKEAVGNNVYLEVVKNGEHSTDNFDFYNIAVKKAFEEIKSSF